jgi:HrpA-like RNA helicase
MVVLRVKQLDLANKNDIFRNPYYFLMATLDPPHLHDIRKSLELLVHEEALMPDGG